VMGADLLPQPGGLEGFLSARIVTHGNDHSVAEAVDAGNLLFEFDPASLAPAEISRYDENSSVTEVPQFLHFDARVFGYVGDLLEGKSKHRVAAGYGRDAEQRTKHRPPLHIRVKQRLDACSIKAAEPVEYPPHDLDVLLRHRPRSIPRRRGGCRPRTARSEDRRATGGVEQLWFRCWDREPPHLRQ